MDAAPQALVIEDMESHRYLAETLLSGVGFTVRCAPSLVLGLTHALDLLAVSAPCRPTLILLDLMLPHERCQILEGTALAAHLTEAMELHALHPAQLVAITGEPTKARVTEARLAGCARTLTKPFTPADAVALRALVDEPPALPSALDATLPAERADEQAVARQILRRQADQIIQLLGSDATNERRRRPSDLLVWTKDQVHTLLTHPAQLLAEEPWRGWVQAHGGLEAVRGQVGNLAVRREHQPLLAAVIRHGSDWRAIVDELHLSKTTYYRRLDELTAELAVALTTLR